MKVHWPKPLFLPGKNETAVLLLHAYTGSSSDMRLLANFLNQAGYSVAVPQLTGHATAEPLDILLEGGITAWRRDVQRVIGQLKQAGFDKILCFGLSMGGFFATEAILYEPLVIGGGTISTPIYKTDFSKLPAEFKRYAQLIYQRTEIDTATQQLNLQRISALVPQQLSEIADYARSLRPALSNLAKPFFIAQGGADQLIDRDGAQILAAKFRAQKPDYHYYPTAGHVLTVNSAHQQLQQDILAFIQTNFNK